MLFCWYVYGKLEVHMVHENNFYPFFKLQISSAKYTGIKWLIFLLLLLFLMHYLLDMWKVRSA